MIYKKNRSAGLGWLRGQPISRLLTTGLLIWWGLVFGDLVQATGTITVNTAMDEFNNGPDCSLREAIETANSDVDFGGCVRNGSPPYTISLPDGTYTLTGSNTEDNNASGDLDLSAPMIITGAGADHTIVQAGVTPGSGVDRVFHVVTAATVQISRVMVRHGLTETGGNGGGIANTGGGTLILIESVVADNRAESKGGGLWNTATGTLTVDKTTISGNWADGNAVTEEEGGGGIFNNGGTLTLSNSTVSSNTARNPGGGLNNQSSATLINVTIYENSADSGAGGINNGGTLTLSNSIVARHIVGLGANCSGVTAGAFNLADDNTCQAAIEGNPLLGPLQNNGGSPPTHALLLNSPAIDTGNNSVCAATPINNQDQRGHKRPVGGTCDLGAQENGSVIYLPLVLKL